MDLKSVGARIKAAREAACLTQEELAERVGISRTHVSVIERGAKAPRLETFVAIANALGASADALLLDVVKQSVQSETTELSGLIAHLSDPEHRRILRALRALLTEE